MTSDEIKNNLLSERDWLKEIAYQLALFNERIDKENEKFFGGLPSAKEKEKEV